MGRLPPPEVEEGLAWGVAFRVVAAENGWFRVEDFHLWDEDRNLAGIVPAGWIPGRHLDFALQTDKAFEAPDPRSAVVAPTWRASDGDHAVAYRLPSDCRGELVRLLVTGHDRAERPAWVRGVCGNQATTCDGMQGDPIPYDEVPERD